jgi:methylated-DNA-[protein]-cysteine S-methyltransferase
MNALVQTLVTPDGPFTILADEDGAVLSSGWTAEPDAVLARLAAADRPGEVRSATVAAADAVVAYYDGDLAAIDGVRVRQRGTELRLAGWAALRGIRAGEPLTYAAFADALGRPTAIRAAASICATNAPALFVPCHRVLRTGGALGGFAWGLPVKRALLARESRENREAGETRAS